eukprot:PLAT13708.2.p1 GENE.PLAT13708.2~~PLAT13708.2.p1  ORF type:complete len:613 (-),score=204.90 PLAT13708.2:44-1810(-)
MGRQKSWAAEEATSPAMWRAMVARKEQEASARVSRLLRKRRWVRQAETARLRLLDMDIPRGWRCGSCTYFNKEKARKCEVCGEPKVAAGKAPWRCESCTYVNQGRDKICTVCSASRPPVIESTLIADLRVMNGSSYEALDIAVGISSHIDQHYKLEDVPFPLLGGTLIKTAQADARAKDMWDFLVFTALANIDVWVAIDHRRADKGTEPAWLIDAFDLQEQHIMLSSRKDMDFFALYKRKFPVLAGETVSLGSNDGDNSHLLNYIVIATPMLEGSALAAALEDEAEAKVAVDAVEEPAVSAALKEMSDAAIATSLPLGGNPIRCSGPPTGQLFVLFCGARGCGKSYLALRVQQELERTLGKGVARCMRLQDGFAMRFARERGLSGEALLRDDSVREEHRAALTAYYEDHRADGLDRVCNKLVAAAQETVRGRVPGVVLVSDVRTASELTWFVRNDKRCSTVLLTACLRTRRLRGWEGDDTVAHGTLDGFTGWHFKYNNDLAGGDTPAALAAALEPLLDAEDPGAAAVTDEESKEAVEARAEADAAAAHAQLQAAKRRLRKSQLLADLRTAEARIAELRRMGACTPPPE